MEEEWKVIPGFSKYEVSTDGRVRSNARKNPIIKSPHYSKFGYPMVSLVADDGKTYGRTIHSLVAEAYVENPDPENYIVIRHLDSDPKNCHYTNLAYGTISMNYRDMMEANRQWTKPVYCYETDTIYHSGQDAARELGLQKASVTNTCKGKTGVTGGYHLCFASDMNERLANLEEWLDDSKSLRWKPVEAYNLSTGENYIFKSHLEAQHALGVTDSGISNVLAGRITNTKGWEFRNLAD